MSSWADKMALFDTQLSQLGVGAAAIEQASREYRKHLPTDAAGAFGAGLHALLTSGAALRSTGASLHQAPHEAPHEADVPPIEVPEPTVEESEPIGAAPSLNHEPAPIPPMDESPLELSVSDIPMVDEVLPQDAAPALDWAEQGATTSETKPDAAEFDIDAPAGELGAEPPQAAPPSLPVAESVNDDDEFSGLMNLDARRNLEVGDLTTGDPTLQRPEAANFGDFDDEATCVVDTIVAE